MKVLGKMATSSVYFHFCTLLDLCHFCYVWRFRPFGQIDIILWLTYFCLFHNCHWHLFGISDNFDISHIFQISDIFITVTFLSYCIFLLEIFGIFNFDDSRWNEKKDYKFFGSNLCDVTQEKGINTFIVPITILTKNCAYVPLWNSFIVRYIVNRSN